MFGPGFLGSGQPCNSAIPLLMRDLLPNGVLGVAVTGLPASFMAGMAANISGFNTVFTNDIWLVDFGTELNASFWGAGIAFAVDVVAFVIWARVRRI